ncbi:MAG TPA: hypothetical protein VF780_04960 [Nitrosospira sp.]
MDQIAREPPELDARRVALDIVEHSTIRAAARGEIKPILYPARYTVDVSGVSRVSLSRPDMAAVPFQR